jgi:heat-inducible transcriptional repressor
MTTPVSEINSRAREVFRVIVESYLNSGEPVGSRTLSKIGGFNLSPASIRNVMQDLEELGLLSAPHTSAGRMPTELGLRLFVDGMMQAAQPTPEERRAIEARVAKSGPIEEALAAASQTLSGLSQCAGLVLVPKRDVRVRQFSFAPLSATQALLVLVGEDGSVENRVIDVPMGATQATLIEAANFMTECFAGLSLAEAVAQVEQEIARERSRLDHLAADLSARGLAQWARDAADRPVLIVRGAANLIDERAATDLDRVRQLLDEIEGKEEIAGLLSSAREGSATKVFIGAENKLFALSGSSVIAAPYHDRGGQVVGVVGVIGPTRLNYARIIPMVDFTANTLTRFMTQ